MNHIIKTQARILGVLFGVYLLIAGASGLIQAHTHSVNRGLLEKNRTEQHFWQAVAGESSTSAVTVDNLLAEDLRVANTSADKISAFRGDSNKYGGITDAIGEDPFDGSSLNCVECGPLKPDVQRKLAQVRAGDVQNVLRDTAQAYDVEGYTFTPFAISAALWLVIVYLMAFPVTYILAHQAMGEKMVKSWHMLVSFPLLWACVSVSNARTGHTQAKNIREQFPDYAQILDQTDEALGKVRIDAPERAILKKTRDDVYTELLRQVSDSHEGKSKDDLRLLMDDLDRTAVAVQAMGSAKDEFETWDK